MSRKNGSYKKNKNTIPFTYIIGIVFLAAAVVLSVKGMLANPSEKTPSPAVSYAPSPNPTGTAAQSPISSPAQSPSTINTASDVAPPPVSTQEPSDSKNISADPIPDTEFKPLDKKYDDIYQGNLILVNNDYPFQFIDFIERVCLYDNKTNSYKVSDSDLYVGENTIEPLNSMLDAFYSKKSTDDVYIISGYRSYDTQQSLFNREIAEKGETEAIHWVARPGTSEHHSGLAIDFGILYDNGEYYEYDGKDDFAWINENCYKYGFVVRYQSEKKNTTGIYYEPWHFRYLGIPHATKITQLGYCLEEYIEYLRNYSYKKPLLIKTDDGSVYETYFCAGLTAYVPKNYSYELSGNNVDGFIVTVKIK